METVDRHFLYVINERDPFLRHFDPVHIGFQHFPFREVFHQYHIRRIAFA